jgi:hypothetical protein
MKQQDKFVARMCISVAFAAGASGAWAQQEAPADDLKDTAATATPQESPIRQSPTATDAAGKSLPARVEKLVLADPDSKMYMPCRDPNEMKTDDSTGFKTNPKAAVMSEEAAKQHGYKGSAHKVVCPKQGEVGR